MKSWLWLPLLIAVGACHEEPPIIIRFEPNDMTGARLATTPVHVDAATAARLVDAGARAPGGEPAKLEDGKKVDSAKKETPPMRAECKVKADCVVEPTDCCDCANGGKQHAIARARAGAAKAARDRKCRDALCTQMFSTDPTCGKRADCQEGSCVLVERQPGEK